MRLRLALAGGMFLIALIFNFPLRYAVSWLAFERIGVVARDVSGSVWNGQLSEARIADLAVREVRASLNLRPLVSRSAMNSVSVRLAGGGFQAEFPIRPGADIRTELLHHAGFAARGGAYIRTLD